MSTGLGTYIPLAWPSYAASISHAIVTRKKPAQGIPQILTLLSSPRTSFPLTSVRFQSSRTNRARSSGVTASAKQTVQRLLAVFRNGQIPINVISAIGKGLRDQVRGCFAIFDYHCANASSVLVISGSLRQSSNRRFGTARFGCPVFRRLPIPWDYIFVSNRVAKVYVEPHEFGGWLRSSLSFSFVVRLAFED